MQIYDEPTKILMQEFAREKLKHGQVFDKKLPIAWFAQHYGKINPITVGMHVEGMSVNSRLRKHHPSIRSGSEHDLFFKLGPGRYRLWDSKVDPQPIYRADLMESEGGEETPGADLDMRDAGEDSEHGETSREFAFEAD